jgi:hypothetical protein
MKLHIWTTADDLHCLRPLEQRFSIIVSAELERARPKGGEDVRRPWLPVAGDGSSSLAICR